MNTTARHLLSAALLLYLALAHATFTVDQKYNGSSTDIGDTKFDEWKAIVEPFYKKWQQKILQAIAEDNEGVAPGNDPGGRDTGRVLWNGKQYYAWAVSYQSAAQIRSNREEVRLKVDRPALPGGGICALYVFDQDLHKIGSLKIDLPENNHRTWCNGIYGLGGAGKSVDGVLVTISYYLTGKKLAQRAEDIGRGWRYMTTLIRFEERGGKLALRQDDTCLGNPNNYDTIASARKALTKCAKTSANP